MRHLSRFIPIRATRNQMTKVQLVEALRRSEVRLGSLAAENDRLRHALEIERANNQFQAGSKTLLQHS
jgi:hypothetical protein